MFWKRYYKRFSVRVKVIAYNAIVKLCHLVEFAILFVSNFFSLFSIAVFNIPISHIIVFLLFLMQSYNLFSYLQIFFNFFSFLAFRSPNNHKFCFAYVPPFSGGGVPLVCWPWSCVLINICPLSYTRAYIHARTIIFRRQFLDIIVIFRRIGIFSFFLPIGIFGAQTAIFRPQKHKFSIKK